MDNAALGARMRARRKELGLTAAELGKRMGMTETQVSRLETGKQGFRSETICALAKVLELEVIALLTDGGETPSAEDIFAYRIPASVQAAMKDKSFSRAALALAAAYVDSPRDFKKTQCVLEAAIKLPSERREGLVAFLRGWK